MMFGAAPNPESCTFCIWECDYGVSNEYFWHPADATSDYCKACQCDSNKFYPEWKYYVNLEGSNQDIRPDRFHELEKMSNQSALSLSERGESPWRPQYVKT